MMREKEITILGDGQIWDLRGIDPKQPRVTFEDLFSGRALAEKAKHVDIVYLKKYGRRLFLKYKEKGKSQPTGISVTKALLSKKDRRAGEKAELLLKQIGENAGRGIEALTKAKGYKPGGSRRELGLWKNLIGVIIGAGVSKGRTGSIIIKSIREYLKKRELGSIKIFKARFHGKEAGFLGAIAYISRLICKEAIKKKLFRIAAIGLDLGRERIGVGILLVNPETRDIIREKKPWIFKYSVLTPGRNKIEDYSKHKEVGQNLRNEIIYRLVSLISKSKQFLEKKGLPYSKHIAVSLPGRTAKDGYVIDSTDYLPFFRKRDGFHFTKAFQERLVREGCRGFSVHIINDGIAAGLANLRYGFNIDEIENGKYAFLGPGSGLGGGLYKIKENNNIKC